MKLLTPQEQLNILKNLQNLLASFSQLAMEPKTRLFCYYLTDRRKRLLFYLNPRKTEVVFGIGHHGTDILETFPMLASLADEVKPSVIKIKIEKIEDIESKAIRYIIEMILNHLK